jgi:hypothetical protein
MQTANNSTPQQVIHTKTLPAHRADHLSDIAPTPGAHSNHHTAAHQLSTAGKMQERCRTHLSSKTIIHTVREHFLMLIG